MSDDTPPDNVLRPTFGQQSEVVDGTQYCRHRSYKLDSALRTVACGACRVQLDPFEVLLDYARDERNWRHWDRECSAKRKLVAELKEEEARVKSRTASASRKDAATAVAEERARTERARVEITRKVRAMARTCKRIEQLARFPRGGAP